ncbi:flavin-containing monooxygenase [Aspergillus ibericus CBS 121593]|uniref:Flavin-binding monooxygenase n=1 Tax=Aspergillus ibericus CBS 121593 TaxID=1448316 RepID=A0A395HF76_9EURO|nr:flavin-binding monooxygenase [Aspergillus ibericus CBS 121593]RAL04884.1 flavin-binding monooxygenase [Aspergillus ibericus CBS 121593]
MAPSMADNEDVKATSAIPSLPNNVSGTSQEQHRYFSPHISERAVDKPRPLKVIYIGAGISGILAAIKFHQAVPNLDLTIYEKNPELGGTWYENNYPGCACDVPSHSYQLSFESWTGWSHFFSGADEILEYWKRVAHKYDVRKDIKFENRCVGARWNDAVGKWFVQILDETDPNGRTFEDSADVLMTGTGMLNEWRWPAIPGLHKFKGKVLHSASWDRRYDTGGKRVAVIGAGSSGIQIVPALVDKVEQMDHYVRGKTWISNQHGGDRLASRTDGKGGNFTYTDEEKRAWQADPVSYIQYRKELELEMQTLYAKSQKGSDLQKLAKINYQADMKRRLKERPDLFTELLPDFPPLCKRLTPGPGYLEALTSPKVNVITAPITAIDETSVITACGTHRTVDVIVCATGFHIGSGFPIIGRDGVNLREKYSQRARSYLGLATDGFPNFFQSLGPNSFQGAGNLLIMLEQVHTYVGQVLSRMAYDNIGLVEPKKTQVDAFTKLCEDYFQRTVYSEDCASWYKTSPLGASDEERNRGRVTALWPGSSLHYIKTLEKVRWEDFALQPYDGNIFGWFGNGWTVAEQQQQIDAAAITSYLDQTDFVDDVEIR